MKTTHRYAGIPHVQRAGLAVLESADRLRRFIHVEEKLMFLMTAHHVMVPERDLKMLLGRLQYEDACHCEELRKRIHEMRTPKGRLKDSPDKLLTLLLDEAAHSADSVELLAALLVIKPALLRAYEDYLVDCNPLADYPTVRLLEKFVADEKEHLRLLQAAYDEAVVGPASHKAAREWATTLTCYLEATGGMDGLHPKKNPLPAARSIKPLTIPHQLKRDDTLKRVWDYKAPPQQDVGHHTAYMMGLRLSEVNVSEGLALVLCEVKDRPWEFYFDLSRHLWDEVRHSLFGEVAIESTCGRRDAVPMRDYEGIYCMEADTMEQYATLGLEVEGANMKYPVGKRGEWEFCRDLAKHPLMTTFQDFDWADEVLHVNIARRRLESWFVGSMAELSEFAAKGKIHRTKVKQRGTQEPLPDIAPHLPGMHDATTTTRG